MGSKTDQIKGYANEAAGKVKQGVTKMLISNEADRLVYEPGFCWAKIGK